MLFPRHSFNINSFITKSSPFHPSFAAKNGLRKFQHQQMLQMMTRQMVREYSRQIKPNLFKQSSFSPLVKRFTTYQTRSNSYLSIPTPKTQNEQALWLLGGLAVLGLAYFLLNQTLNRPGVGEGFAPEVARYLRGTYAYLLGGISMTAASAVAFWRTGIALRLLATHPVLWMVGGLFGCIGLLIACRTVDPRNVALKHSLFIAFSILEGFTLSIYGIYGGAVLQKAAIYTLGIFLAMSFIALNAKNERFLYMGGALYSCLMVLIMASFANLGLAFFGKMPRTVATMDAIIVWAALALFTAFLLYDTQVIVRNGKQYAALEKSGRVASAVSITGPRAGPVPDYINESLRLYVDLLNIFVSLVRIFAGNQRRR